MLLKTLIGTIAIASIACSVYAREVHNALKSHEVTTNVSRGDKTFEREVSKDNGQTTRSLEIHGDNVDIDRNATHETQ